MSSNLKLFLLKIWDGFCSHIGEMLCVFLLFILTQLYHHIEFIKNKINAIPTLWLFIATVALAMCAIYLYFKNKKLAKNSNLQNTSPFYESSKNGMRFVTHCGVWWKINEDSDYIEDFPYCPCCEPHKKLIQKDWHPDEIFYCPTTKNEIKIFSGEDYSVPMHRQRILNSLYSTYFHRPRQEFQIENHKIYNKIKKDKPNLSEREQLDLTLQDIRVFKENDKLREELLNKFDNFNDLNQHISKHYKMYCKKYKK